jgi:hypothetical protein
MVTEFSAPHFHELIFSGAFFIVSSRDATSTSSKLVIPGGNHRGGRCDKTFSSLAVSIIQ